MITLAWQREGGEFDPKIFAAHAAAEAEDILAAERERFPRNKGGKGRGKRISRKRGSPEDAAYWVSVTASAALDAFLNPDPHPIDWAKRLACTWSEFGAAWQALVIAKEAAALTADDLRRRASPGAAAVRDRARERNAPLYAAAVDIIRLSKFRISANGCATQLEAVGGFGEARNIRQKLQDRGLFKQRPDAVEYLPDRELVEREFPVLERKVG